MGVSKAVSNGIASTALWSSRNAKAVVAVALIITAGLGYGVTLITTNVDVADVLPRGNPNTEAAQNLTTEFKSTFTQQVTFQIHVNPDRWEENNERLQFRGSQLFGEQATEGSPAGPYQLQQNRHNITDEVYVRAMHEMVGFIQDRTAFERQISISNIYALVNWTVAGGQDSAPETSFSLPGYGSPDAAAQYTVVDQAVKAALLETVDTLASPSWNHAAVLFMPASNTEVSQAELGKTIMDARDEYVAAVDACIAGNECELEWTVFGSDNPPLLTVDLPVANAHSSEIVEHDMVNLIPWICVLIIVFLFIAFRDPRAIAISFVSLGIGVTWTYGLMGWMGIALNTLNMTIVPLIMGVGIDYAIHMINEFIEHKSTGAPDDEAFREAGDRAGLAMFIATLTTALGLVVMMVSPSLLMAQLGFLSAVAIVAIYVLTITFIPAAITLLGGTDKMGASFTRSKLMPKLARAVTKGRFLVLGLVVLMTAVAYWGVPGTAYGGMQSLEEEAFGDPGKNFPEDDPVRQEHEQGLRYFYEMEDPDVKANILTFEGPGILTPETMAYMREIERNLATKDRVISDTLRTVPFFIETWLTVKDGAAGAGTDVALGNILEQEIIPGPAAEQVDNFPKTEEEIRAEISAMYNSPMNELASIIANYPTIIDNPDRGIAAMTFSVRAATYDEAEDVWHQVWDAVGKANATFGGSPPDGVNVAFVGNTATNYLFVAEELPWLGYMSYAATIILFILVLVFTQDLKATIVATLLAGLTSIWWLGILPLLNIGLAITLMLPLVFIFNIGTDYAVHIIWNQKQLRNSRKVFETTGKAILFSAVTTAGAFAIFTLVQNVAVSRTMVATTISIFVIFLATLLLIPIFYPVRHEGWSVDDQDKLAAEKQAQKQAKIDAAAAKQKQLGLKAQAEYDAKQEVIRQRKARRAAEKEKQKQARAAQAAQQEAAATPITAPKKAAKPVKPAKSKPAAKDSKEAGQPLRAVKRPKEN